ncbi:MAG: hypothetical protein GY861_08535 [bacterium]|nr:hypothetical protein [bacterium]
MDIKDRVSDGAFFCSMVLEVIGSPAEYVDTTLTDVIKQLKEAEGVEITKETFNKAEKQDKHFTAFVELEILFKDVSTMLGICFDYMPSSIEIIEPEDLHTKSKNLTDWMNDLLEKLHTVDMRLKNANASGIVLEKNADALLMNILRLLLKDGAKTPSELTPDIGVAEKQLIPFLERFTKMGIMEKDGEKYSMKNG